VGQGGLDNAATLEPRRPGAQIAKSCQRCADTDRKAAAHERDRATGNGTTGQEPWYPSTAACRGGHWHAVGTTRDESRSTPANPPGKGIRPPRLANQITDPDDAEGVDRAADCMEGRHMTIYVESQVAQEARRSGLRRRGGSA